MIRRDSAWTASAVTWIARLKGESVAKAESPLYSFLVVACGYVVVAIAFLIAFALLFSPNGKELALVACFCGAAVCQVIAVDKMGAYDLDMLTSLLAKLPVLNPLMYLAAWGYTDGLSSWIVMGIWTLRLVMPLTFNLIRIVIGSYFAAVSLDLVNGVNQKAMFLPFMPETFADIVGSTILLVTSLACHL